MMNNHRPPSPSLEMQLARVQKNEKRIRQNTYSPIMYGNKIVALAKFVRDDAEPIGRDHPVFRFRPGAGFRFFLANSGPPGGAVEFQGGVGKNEASCRPRVT